jgi:hypothetical protein
VSCRCGKLETDAVVDMLLFICCDVSPTLKLGDFDCKTRQEFKDQMVAECIKLDADATEAKNPSRRQQYNMSIQ